MSTHIHFICIGNAYRSRLAETYLKSLGIPNVKTTSSGLETEKHRPRNGPIIWYALRIARKQKIIQHLTQNSVQTNLLHIIGPDLVVFLHPEVFNMHKKLFEIEPRKYEIWKIPDVPQLNISKDLDPNNVEKEIIKITEATYEKIKKKVDKLVKTL